MIGQLLVCFMFLLVVQPCTGIASLHIRTIPHNLQVFVDNHYFGISPLTIDSLACGLHQISIQVPPEIGWGTVTADTTLCVKQGRNNVTILLPGTLHVSTQPGGALILTDGKPVGYTPLFLSRPSTRSYLIRVEAADALAHELTWLPKAGALTETEVVLFPTISNPVRGNDVLPLVTKLAVAGLSMAAASVICSREAERSYEQYSRSAAPPEIDDLYRRAALYDKWASSLWVGFQVSVVSAVVVWALDH